MTKDTRKISFYVLMLILISSLLSPTVAMAQSSDTNEEVAIRSTIDEYFRLKYEARAVMTPKDFGHLIASTAKSQNYVNGELDRREIEYHRAKLFNLGYVSYKYNLDYQSIQVDLSTRTASVELLEGHEVVFAATAPEVSQMAGLQHVIALSRASGVWKIVDDQYEDALVRMMNQGVTKAEALGINYKNYQEIMSQQKKQTSAVSQPDGILSGHSLNRAGAVNYAANWWYRWNTPRYQNLDDYGGDCANFVSQALADGGGVAETIVHPDGWFYQQYDTNRPPSDSASWDGADDFWKFVLNRQYWDGGPEGYSVSSYTTLSGGDTIDYDWNGDGYYDHVVLVTLNPGYPTGYVLIASHNPYLYNYPHTYSGWSGILYIRITGW